VDGLVVLFGLGLVAAIIGVPIAAFVALSRTGRLQRALAELERQVQRLRSDAQALQLRLDAAPEQTKAAAAPGAAAPVPPLPVVPDTMPEEAEAGPTPAVPQPAIPPVAEVEVAPPIPAPAVTPPLPLPFTPVPATAESKGGVWWPGEIEAAPPIPVVAAAETSAPPPSPTVAESAPVLEPAPTADAAAAVVDEKPVSMGSEIARQQRLASMPQAAVDVAGLEERLGARLFIWIGGIALALAGAFLVKYSIDQGWLGPAVRCAFGVALGVALLGGGEWMRSREGRIAQSLSAAGVAVLYASLFASIRLYHLIDPAFGFLALAGLTAGAIALALRQGQFVALLGLAGGFVTPLIVHSDEPHALVLFAYLFAIQFGSQVLMRRRGWWWPSAIAVAGGFLWVAGWISAVPRDWSNDVWLAVFLLATSAAAAWTQRARSVPERLESWTPADWQGPTTHALALVAMTGLVAAAGYDLNGWLFFGLLAAGQLVLARLRVEQEPLAALGAALAALLLVGWPIATVALSADPSRFVGVALSIGALFACGGFGALWGARQPVRWALLSVLSTVAVFLIAYARLRGIAELPSWGLISLLLAAPAAVAAAAVARRRAVSRGYEESLGVYALAASGFIAFAIPLELEHAWIAVGWALLLPAIAWIESRLHIAWFRYAAWVAAGLVLARLLPGPWVVGFETGASPIFNWLLYGYGVPLVAFGGAAWQFRRERDDALVTVLEAGTVAIGFLLVTLELHHYFQGGLVYRFDLGLVQATGFAVAWLLIALGLARAARLDPRPARVWGMRIVTGLAVVMLVGGSLMAVNPLIASEPVGSLPLLNWLAFAYALPALLLVGIAREIERSAEPGLAIWLQGLAGILGLLFVSLEIRQLFHGTDLVLYDIGLTELSCLIAAWLVIALGLAYVLRRVQRPVLRGGMQIVTALAVATLIGGPLLALNPLLSWEPIGERPLLNLLLLVYGLPALLLAALGYALEPSADRRLASVLQGLSGAVGLFFISLEIRQLFHGAVLVLGDIGLAELSCMIIAWLLIAFGLFRLAVGERSAQRQIMARVVAGLAVVALVLGSLLYANPLLGIQDVGAWPLLNWLVPAYAVPALLVAMLSRGLQDPKRPWLALALASLALVLGFAFVTLELRQWFQGSRLDDGSVGSAENYAYSVVWILYGVALLVAGILRGGATLRWASLVVVLLAVGKVFLLDAAVLTGLYRVASFFGLGVSLMVIGYVYQRVVFGHPAGPTPAVSPPPMRS